MNVNHQWFGASRGSVASHRDPKSAANFGYDNAYRLIIGVLREDEVCVRDKLHAEAFSWSVLSAAESVPMGRPLTNRITITNWILSAKLMTAFQKTSSSSQRFKSMVIYFNLN